MRHAKHALEAAQEELRSLRAERDELRAELEAADCEKAEKRALALAEALRDLLGGMLRTHGDEDSGEALYSVRVAGVAKALAALADPNLGADWVSRAELEAAQSELAERARACRERHVAAPWAEAELRRVAEAVRDWCSHHIRNSPRFEGVITTPSDNGLLGRVAQDIENIDLDVLLEGK